MRLPNFKPVDVVVTMLAAATAIGLLAHTIANAVDGDELTDSEERMWSTILGSVLAIISLYVGAKVNRKRNGKNESRD